MAVAATACSLLVDQSDAQCNTTADCLALGPRFAQSYCASRTCQSPCTTNAQCTGTNTSDPWICRADRTCAPLLSEDCTTLLTDSEDLSDPVLTPAGETAADAGTQVVWLGMLLPLDPSTAPLSKAKEDAANLARGDFNANGGLPPVGLVGPIRRFAFVVCDDTADPVRAATHLTTDVRVPAIIGPVYSDTLVTVATAVTDQAGVLLLTPTATAVDISDLSEPENLIWRTCPSDAVQGQAMALVIEQTIAPEAQNGLDAGAPLKVANVHKGDAYGTGLGSALDQDLFFNDAGASANGQSGNYLNFDYGDPSETDASAEATEYTKAVADVLALAPDVIALVGTEEVITSIMAPIEAAWPAANGAHPLPYYLLSDGAYPRPELLALVGTNANLRARVLGTQPGPTANYPPYLGFLSYYGDMISDGTTPVLSTASTYDAAYLLAYAIAAIGPESMTGPNLVAGLKRVVVPRTSPIKVGPNDISVALGAVAEDGGISEGGSAAEAIIGSSGPLYYPDPSHGDPVGEIQVWCLSVDPDGGAVNGFPNSGLYFDPTMNMTKLEGTKEYCP